MFFIGAKGSLDRAEKVAWIGARSASDEVKEAEGEVLELVFRRPSKFEGEGTDEARGVGGRPATVVGLHPTRLKVKREFLFESLLIFKPTQLKRAARPACNEFRDVPAASGRPYRSCPSEQHYRMRFGIAIKPSTLLRRK